MSNQTNSLMKRYKDAYLVARSTNGFGILIKTIGIIVGALFVVGGLYLANEGRGAQMFGLMAVGLGIFIGMLFYLLGILISAQGQILKASLDSAVNTSPFLTNRDRAALMSLAQINTSEVDRSVKPSSATKTVSVDDVGFPWKDI